MNLIKYATFVAALLVGSPNLFAGSEQLKDSKDSKEQPVVTKSWCETPDPWEVRVGIPGWISAIGGDFGVKGVVAPLDVSFSTLLDHMDAIPIVLSAYVRHDRWEFFGDGEYVQFDDSVTLPGLFFTNAHLGLEFGMIEGFAGYRLINCKNASLSLYAGARYTYYSGDFRIQNSNDPRFPIVRDLLGIPESGQVSGSTGWVDPVIGIGGRVHLWKPFSLWANADVGGFDLSGDSAFEISRDAAGAPVLRSISSSDWSYQLQGGIEIQLTRNIWTQLGWRYLKYDYVSGGYTNKTDLNGFFTQTGFNF